MRNTCNFVSHYTQHKGGSHHATQTLRDDVGDATWQRDEAAREGRGGDERVEVAARGGGGGEDEDGEDEDVENGNRLRRTFVSARR
jgi:hypothetical protein